VLQCPSILPRRLENFNPMQNPLTLFRLLLLVFVVGISLAWIASATAQSGRRGQTPTTAEPAPTPSPAPTPRKPDVEKATVNFIVGVDRNGFSNIPLSYYTSVAQACAERLDDGPSVKVDFASKAMTRSDALNSARAAKEGFVVWLQLKAENLDNDQIAENLNQIYVEYTVFTATTAKTATWGHTYQPGYRKGGVVNTPGTNRGNRSYSDYLLRQAGAEAAERILEALKIATFPRRFASESRTRLVGVASGLKASTLQRAPNMSARS
jgi:hypothetical protein